MGDPGMAVPAATLATGDAAVATDHGQQNDDKSREE
jgi:hypothetical protein